MPKQIPLSGKIGAGKFAIVDDSDFEHLSQYRWRYSQGYALRNATVNGKEITILMHRVILNLQPGQQADHINGDKLDNRRSNLRAATHADNLRNRPAHGRHSQYKGVCYDITNRRWKYTLQVDNQRIGGYRSTEIEAARAYDALAIQHHGDFAWLNFPPETHKQNRTHVLVTK